MKSNQCESELTLYNKKMFVIAFALNIAFLLSGCSSTPKAAPTASDLALSQAITERLERDAPEVLHSRNDAITADAAKVASKKWMIAEDDFQNELKELAKHDDRMISPKKRSELHKEFVAAQNLAEKKYYLKETYEVINHLDDHNAKLLIPSAMKDAKKKTSEAEATIEEDPNNVHNIIAAVESAQASAQYAQDLYHRAQNVKSESPEEAAALMLAQEKSNRELTTQLSDAENERSKVKSDLSEAEKARQALQGKNDIQNYVSGLQSRFNPDEAEVFQQGNDVLIRLKGMEFPPSRAEIPSKSLGLLESVKKTIP